MWGCWRRPPACGCFAAPWPDIAVGAATAALFSGRPSGWHNFLYGSPYNDRCPFGNDCMEGHDAIREWHLLK